MRANIDGLWPQTRVAVAFQLIAYDIVKISIRDAIVPLYEFAAKQPKKEHKLGGKNFLEKLSTSKDMDL